LIDLNKGLIGVLTGHRPFDLLPRIYEDNFKLGKLSGYPWRPTERQTFGSISFEPMATNGPQGIGERALRYE
jgi:hypothetical protein